VNCVLLLAAAENVAVVGFDVHAQAVTLALLGEALPDKLIGALTQPVVVANVIEGTGF
jgi:hypothetical protein